MNRRLSLGLAMVLIVGACAYESSGTTTTTLPLTDDQPVPTGPADLVVSDQRSEGSSVVIDSVSMPSAGFVVVRMDEGGSPGEIIGISSLLQKGVIAGVSIPFLLPLSESSTVQIAIHIDVDEDGSFIYEPPDAFIDEIATRANGEPAVGSIHLTLLPPLSPGDAFIDEQVSDGTAVVIAGGVLPAPGFLAVHANDNGAPGAVLAVSDLKPAGTVEELALGPVPPLTETGPVFVVAWVDRDENGVFSPGEDGDAMAVRDDGTLASGTAIVTVFARFPAAVDVANQTTSGASFTAARIVQPSRGFLEILEDNGGAPGDRIGVFNPTVGSHSNVVVPLPAGVTTGDRIWLRLWVDFDQSGTLTEGDLPALVELGGDPLEVSFVLTIGTP